MDIDNERLPPEIVNPDSKASKPIFSNHPILPNGTQSPITPGEIKNDALSGRLPATPNSGSTAKLDPANEARGFSTEAFRGGHTRQQSLGTTRTSPSNRQRSVESTMSLIREAVAEADEGGDQTNSQH
jgi:serine/threonine-protein phosphatase 2B catalytic subunit